jgi:protein involved in temperature-dependent protein secretion
MAGVLGDRVFKMDWSDMSIEDKLDYLKEELDCCPTKRDLTQILVQLHEVQGAIQRLQRQVGHGSVEKASASS